MWPLQDEQELTQQLLQGLDKDEEQQFTLFNFSLYDDHGHLVPLDSELIEKGRKIKFCGTIKVTNWSVEVVKGQ